MYRVRQNNFEKHEFLTLRTIGPKIVTFLIEKHSRLHKKSRTNSQLRLYYNDQI